MSTTNPPPPPAEYFLNDLIDQNQKVDLESEPWISNVYLHILPGTSDPKWQYYTHFECELLDQNGTKYTLKDIFKVKNSNRNLDNRTISLVKDDILDLFKYIQNGKVSGISRLFFWVREALYHTRKRIRYYLDPILGEPGKKLRLGKDTDSGKVCRECDNFLLRFAEINDITKKECPYCGKPLKISQRKRRYQKLGMIKDSPIKQIPTGLQFHAEFHNRQVPLNLTLTKINSFFRNFQSLSNDRMGPFRLRIEDSWNYRVKALEPLDLEDSAWHESEIFPEDMLM